MPLWTDAYLADTRHLSDAEHGRYLLLLMDMWRSPGCRFPNDRAWLERRFRRSPEAFDQDIQPILNEFCKCDGNWWTQKKLLKVWRHVTRKARSNSAAAKVRWNKENDACERNATGSNANAMLPKPKPNHDSIPHTPTECIPLEGGSALNGHDLQRTRSDRGTRLSEDWTPGEEGIAYARTHGFSDEKINAMFEDFRDTFLAKAGPSARKVSWPRTWKRWVRTEHERVREQEARERRIAERYGKASH
jgi:uncharacterized protein YdaU (DUF1376 family)